MAREVSLQGMALHAGVPARAVLRAAPGPVRVVQGGHAAALAELRVVRADAGVSVVGPGGAPAIDLCEHLLAALGGAGVHNGVEVEVEGPELPLLDGGAAAFCDALAAIDAPRSLASLHVARAGRFAEGDACYRLEPSEAMHIEVDVEFPAPVGRERAAWSGDARDFRQRIAPARTFGWKADHAALLARGRARGAAALAGLLVFDGDGVLDGCAPPSPQECARHKLLDLVGDLTLHGGMRRGRLHASRPGHAATHAVVRRALAEGVLALAGSEP